jgi:hypothetical protein
MEQISVALAKPIKLSFAIQSQKDGLVISIKVVACATNLMTLPLSI